jgi:hypothetical protein
MVIKVVYVLNPTRRSWYTKKYYSNEFPAELHSSNFSQSKFNRMVQDLNRHAIYDIGPLLVAAWFLLCAIVPVFSLIITGNFADVMFAYMGGAIPVFLIIWFVLKQVGDTGLNSVLLKAKDDSFPLEMDWYGRITFSKNASV